MIKLNQQIVDFSFWTPVVFENVGKSKRSSTPTTKDSWSDLAWKIGSWVDQFLYLGSSAITVKPESVNHHKCSFERKSIDNISMWTTAAKATTYVLSMASAIWVGWPVFILPVVALAIKVAFKWQLNSIAVLKDNQNELLAEKFFGKTRVALYLGAKGGDALLDETTDAVVNAANPNLKALGGICGEFRRLAGEDIFYECKAILNDQKREEIDDGEAVLTTAGDLKAKIKAIVHAAGPRYDEKDADKVDYPKLLSDAYRTSLELITDPLNPKFEKFISKEVGNQLRAKDVRPMRTIGFPSISTGIFRFPLDLAAETALNTVKEFCEKNPDALDDVRFVFLPLSKDKDTPAAFEKALEAL